MKRIIFLVVWTCLSSFLFATDTLFVESFSADWGRFTLEEQKYDGCTYASMWYVDKTYQYAKCSANQGGVSKGSCDCRLISPSVDLSQYSSATLTFQHTTYAASAMDATYFLVRVRTNKSEWQSLVIPLWPAQRWHFETCEIDLTPYIANDTQICFEYLSTDDYAGTWEVKNVCVTAEKTQSKEYTLNVSAGQGGSVNTEINGLYEEGMLVTLRATPDEGYQFVAWSDGVEQNPREVKMTGNVSLQALFDMLPEPCLYGELNGLQGDYLWREMNELMKEHKILTYDAVRADRAYVDVVDGRVVDMYSNCQFNTSDYCNGSNYDTKVECECYNREHALPKSWWGGSQTEPMYTDLHHVIPTDNATNNQRSAWVYGEVYSATWSNSFGSKLGTSSSYGNNTTAFEPADEVKGDIARMYFYMITCYMDKNFRVGGKGAWMFTYNGTAGFTSNALNLLLKWHRQDPVSDREMDRNNRVEKKQGNRNLFVDIPELAEYIWGNKKGKTYYCGGSAIEEIAVPILDEHQPMYNLLGQPVASDYHGIVIQNGCKYIR